MAESNFSAVMAGIKEQGLLEVLDKHRGAEPLEELVDRFLVARKGKVADALKMLVEDLEWREKEGTLELQAATAHQVLNGEMNPAGKDLHDSMFPHGLLGFDYQNRPIVYKKFGKPFSAQKLQDDANIHVDDLVKYHLWTVERLAASMDHKGKWVLIMDLQGWNLGHFTNLHMKYVQGLIKIDSNHYPERLGRVFLINVPTVFSACWSMVKMWLDADTKAKVCLYSNEAKWKEEMAKDLSLDLLPDHLGGTGKLRYQPHSMDPQASGPGGGGGGTPLSATAN
mmetsp:Transcript_58966/g.138685  ORF Transcript_58966/g.138685 Transcript_58966/m.138685 type:complete len:282 (+) Transcript_58966:55-900(+)